MRKSIMTIDHRNDIWDVVVIGGGIAGLTAAQHCARRGLSVTLLEASAMVGGLVSTINALDDWPALSAVSGVALASSLADQVRAAGVDITPKAALSLGLSAAPGEPLHIAIDGKTLKARRIIVASGARLRNLEAPGSDRLRGKGVSQCADCDGGFFKGQDVVVVGGGDAAIQEALILARTSATVHVVVRGALRARHAYIDRASNTGNIKFIWDSTVDAVLGSDAVSGVTLRNIKSGSASHLPCSAVFPFIGSRPNAEFLPADIARDATGAVVTDAQLRTSLPAIYAVGAVRAGYCGDLLAAAGEAATAAAAIAREQSPQPL